MFTKIEEKLVEFYEGKKLDSQNSYYTHQLIIDFDANQENASSPNDKTIFAEAALLLKEKWDKRHCNPCILIDGFNKEELPVSIPHKPNEEVRLRIYVHGHCREGSNYLSSTKGRKIRFDELAHMIAKQIQNHKAIVNIVGCCAARGKKDLHQDSFAAKLHLELFKLLERDVLVVARMELTCLTSKNEMDGKIIFKITGKLGTTNELLTLQNLLADAKEHKDDLSFLYSKQASLTAHKEIGIKVIFSMENNQQVKADAYEFLLKYALYNAIVRFKNSPNTSKQMIAQQWLKQFDVVDINNLFQMVEQEINKETTVFKKFDTLTSSFFNNYVFQQSNDDGYYPIKKTIDRKKQIEDTKDKKIPKGYTGNQYKS